MVLKKINSMNVLQNQAKIFCNSKVGTEPNPMLSNIKRQLEIEIETLFREDDKLAFLAFLLQEIDNDIIEHKRRCGKPEGECGYENNTNNWRFLIHQEIEKIAAEQKFSITKEEQFNSEEILCKFRCKLTPHSVSN
jgi:hypothetical protein